ncbi:MAG: exodeoxyribonuclease I [Pseudomonadales bacterium]|nr:exodeoxyribonuclease I [Pseudomonadales bacterium]
MTGNTLYWHDYETFGSDPRRDRACQFAGVRTDEDLNVIDDPLILYCQPSRDSLPEPEACLITGIGPLQARAKGLCEAEFCARILEEFARPGTCVAGYNNIRFDDEVTRHMLYRCFHDPYEREWKNGNSRWDIIDMLRLTQAVRPAGIHWPRHEDGTPSFRLEELTRANGLAHDSAHDAMSDVHATIAMARLVKEKQPRLYDYLYSRRHKNTLLPLLDLVMQTPVLHVSSRYPASRNCLAVVLPVARHPVNSNGIIVCDLAMDPADWIDLSVDAIRERLFSPKDALPEGIERVPLKTIHVNKCPVIAPLSVLDEASRRRLGIDLELSARHRESLRASSGLAAKIAAVFAEPAPGAAGSGDPDLMLYSGGFFTPGDRALMNRIGAMTPAQLGAFKPAFKDARLPEMLFRYRARNYPQSLDADERARWDEFCRTRLGHAGDGSLDLPGFWRKLHSARDSAPANRLAVLQELEEYVSTLSRELGLADTEAAS